MRACPRPLLLTPAARMAAACRFPAWGELLARSIGCSDPNERAKWNS